jgi:hypothetical protein
MKIECAQELKKKTDIIFSDMMFLMKNYQDVLNAEEFLDIKSKIDNAINLIYVECLEKYVYQNNPEVIPK